MASENELEIVLSLIDNASAELKRITAEIKKDTQGIAKESEKATKSLGDGMKQAGKEIKSFRQEMFAATAVIASITIAVREWGKHNYETKTSLDYLGTTIKNITASIGSLFAPALIYITKILQAITPAIQFIIGKLQALLTIMAQTNAYLMNFVVAFHTSMKNGAGLMNSLKIANIEARESFREVGEEFKKAFAENIPQIGLAKTKIDEMNQGLQALNIFYLTGKATAQEYYDILTSSDVANFQNMQTRMQLMQQMAEQENLMNNASLMNDVTNTNAKIGLLKTLQNYHHTAYSAMMDFTNMVVQKMSTGLGTTISSIIMGTKKASEAWKEFGNSMVSAIIEFVVQYAAQMLIAFAISKLIIASTTAQADALALAWYPAALLASVATLGGASATGLAALSLAEGAGMASELARIVVRKSASELTPKASGGWVGLNGPEVALVGERGPEYVIPNHQLGNMGGQTSIHIEVNNPVVRSDEDIDKLTEEISLRLAREAERL